MLLNSLFQCIRLSAIVTACGGTLEDVDPGRHGKKGTLPKSAGMVLEMAPRVVPLKAGSNLQSRLRRD